MYVNVDIEESSVACRNERLQHSVPLAWQVEVQVHRLAIDCHLACARLHVNQRTRRLTLAVAPGSGIFVDVIGPFFGRQHASEVEQVDAIELDEVVRVQVSLAAAVVDNVIVFAFVEL